MFRPNAERDLENSCVENSLLCGVCVVCACMRVLCVRDMYIQRCRHSPKHTHIHILMKTLMYVEARSGTSWYETKMFQTQTSMSKPLTLEERGHGARQISGNIL